VLSGLRGASSGHQRLNYAGEASLVPSWLARVLRSRLFILEREGQFGHQLRLRAALVIHLSLLCRFHVVNSFAVDRLRVLAACRDECLSARQIPIEDLARGALIVTIRPRQRMHLVCRASCPSHELLRRFIEEGLYFALGVRCGFCAALTRIYRRALIDFLASRFDLTLAGAYRVRGLLSRVQAVREVHAARLRHVDVASGHAL